MKHPSFFRGVAFALGVSVIGSMVYTGLITLLPVSTALRLLIAGIGLAYLLFLLSSSHEKIGHVTAVGAWLVIAASVWFLVPSLMPYLLIHIGLIWLMRSLYFYSSLLPALLDLGLNALSLAAAVWAMIQTGSVFLSIWCFFLGQALFVSIPAHLSRKAEQAWPKETNEDRFQQAQRAAENALRRLSSI